MNQLRHAVMPVYIAIDVSASMAGEIDQLSDAIAQVIDALSANPVVSDRIRIAILTFADSAQVILPLSDPALVTEPRRLSIGGITRYGDVLNLLRSEIERNVSDLKSEGFSVYRPAVFFLTDGAPTDHDWRASMRALQDVGFRAHPNIVAFGVGSADPGILQEISSKPGFAFQSAIDAAPSEAVVAFASALTRSLVNSGIALSSGGGDFVLAPPPTWVRVPWGDDPR